MHKSHFLAGTEIQKKFCKKYLNTLTKVKTASKKVYYRQDFGRNLNNPRKTWKLNRSALLVKQSRTNKQTNKQIEKRSFKIDGQEINESSSIAEKLNKHFVSVGKNLAAKIRTIENNLFSKCLKQKAASSMFLEPPRHSEEFNILHSLHLRKSSGHDNIDSYFIRIACNVLTPYLTYLFHLSFEFGIFTDYPKTAKIIPIFKAEPKTEINNYRPISLLSNFSKILEKLFYSRLSKFLEKNEIIHPNQYGFRQNLTTTYAKLDIMSKINNLYEWKETKFTGLIFLDLRKAFDTVSHNMLLQKLHHYCVRGVVYNLLKSYLTALKQLVYINGSYFTTKKLQFGVPQKSNPGPILFPIYVNDTFNIFDFTPVLYADDTCLWVKASKEKDLESLMNPEVEIAYH